MSPQRHVLPTYSEYIKSLPTPKRLNVEKTVNNIQDAPHSPPTLDALSPRTKESKKDMYRNMHHESSPAPSDHGMDDDDTFDSEGGYDDHGVTHLSNRANALLSRISTADESDESPRNTSTPLISPRKSQSQRSLGQSAPILSISNEVSAIHVNKSMNNTIEVQDFLSVDSMSEGGDAENSKSRYHTSSPNSELPLESDTNPPTVSEEKDNEIKPRIISKKQATVIGVNRVAETETIPVSQQLSSSRNLTVTDSSSKWIVATKAEKADSHLQQDSHENLQNLELSSDVNIMSTSIIQNEQRNDAQKNNQDSLDLGDYVFPNDSDTDDSVIDQHLESRERSHSVEVDKVHEFPDISRSQVLQDASSLTINDSKTTENGKLRSVSQDIVPILNFSSQQMAQPIRENPVERVQLQQISENQKASIVEILQPSSPKYHDQVQSSHHADHESVMDSQIRYHRNMPITSSTAPDYQMEQMIQRIRILEAESRARREQLLLDEEKYKLSESAWSGEIVSLKVYIKDIEAKLQEERSRNRKLLSEVASRDAEIASLTCKYCTCISRIDISSLT